MPIAHVDIIIPPVWSGVYLNIARLLKYSLEDMSISAIIIEAGEKQQGDLSIILGWHLIPNKAVIEGAYIIYQLEPLILPLWQEKIRQKMQLFEGAKTIWDYSDANETYLTHLGFQAEVVPLGYHAQLNEVSHAEFTDYDVLFVGFLTERRKKIIDELKEYCCINTQPRWGKDFAEALGRSKILLNIHQYDLPTPLEQPRISYALNNGSFVISENSTDNPIEGLVTCNYENIKNTVLHFLYNQRERQEVNDMVSNNFKEMNMTKKLEKLLNGLMKKSG